MSAHPRSINRLTVHAEVTMAGPALRVFADDDELGCSGSAGGGTVGPMTQLHLAEPAREEAAWTLTEWWTRTVRPSMVARGTAASTLANYETYLKRWRAWSNLRSHTPKVQEISPLTLEDFRTYLLSAEKVSAQNADKHIKAVSHLLKRAQDAWIIPRHAKLSALAPKPTGLKFTFSADEMCALYAGTTAVAWPRTWQDGRRCNLAADYWRAYLVGGWNYGFRPQEWWSHERSAMAITWAGVIWDAQMLIEGRLVANEHGWLRWRQDKTGHVVIVPMNAVVQTHLRRLWDVLPAKRRQADRRIWDFPLSPGTSKGKRPVKASSGFYAAWWDLVERAGIEPQRDAQGRPTTHRPSHFRKTARTLHGDLIGNAADWITGHRSGKSVGERIYYNAVGKVIESLQAIEQPAAFLRRG